MPPKHGRFPRPPRKRDRCASGSPQVCFPQKTVTFCSFACSNHFRSPNKKKAKCFIVAKQSKAGEHMYTDPGSGLFFVQVLAAGILTVAYRFRKLFTGRTGAKRGVSAD